MTSTKGQRSCLGCRLKKEKNKLIRVVVNQKGEVVLDPQQKMKGRGAYFCPTGSLESKVKNHCLQQAIERKAFKNAFKKRKIKKIKIPTAGSGCSRTC